MRLIIRMLHKVWGKKSPNLLFGLFMSRDYKVSSDERNALNIRMEMDFLVMEKVIMKATKRNESKLNGEEGSHHEDSCGFPTNTEKLMNWLKTDDN
jgi:hypothetical protein